jgi:alpha-L-fucosidase 2
MLKRDRYCMHKGWVLICWAAFFTGQAQGWDNLTLLFDKPVEADRWQQEGLPIGCGRIGAVIDGGIEREHLFYSEISHWTGDSHEDRDSVGFPRPFGDIYVDVNTRDQSVTDYKRQLDLANAIHTVTYTSNQQTFTRESFCSYPDQVLVMRFSCSHAGKLTLDVRQSCQIPETNISVAHNTITLSGQDIIHSAADKAVLPGLHFESQLLVRAQGGSIRDLESSVQVENADEVVLIMAAGTDFAQVPSVWRGPHPHKRLAEQLRAAARKSYDELRSTHIADYRRLFSRVSLHLGGDAYQAKLTTDARLSEYKSNGRDLGLEELYFNMGRYKLISCSRPNQLPANLQGVWNNSLKPPWHGDYHTDINVQMNYWACEVTNLAELHEPLLAYIESIIPFRRRQTLEEFNHRGWFVRTMMNSVGASAWKGCLPANAWFARHFFEHYEFSQDEAFLRDRAYPVLKEVCEFWQDHLIEDQDGSLVTPDGWSPEKPWVEPGIAFDQQLIQDVFTNYIKASTVLDIDPTYRADVKDTLEHLSTGLRIGKWGQLQERKEDLDDPDDKARHFSHLMCVFPLNQVSPLIDPRFAEAAKVSLTARGEDRNGWNNSWQSCCFARLLDSEKAYHFFNRLLCQSTSANLFNHAPVFRQAYQFEGNQGGVAAVAEMLLQSQHGELHLLPALPDAWRTGHVRGLCARGGYIVSMEWHNGKLSAAAIEATVDTICRLRTPEPVEVKLNGKAISATHLPDESYSLIEFPVKSGQVYVIGKPTRQTTRNTN